MYAEVDEGVPLREAAAVDGVPRVRAFDDELPGEEDLPSPKRSSSPGSLSAELVARLFFLPLLRLREAPSSSSESMKSSKAAFNFLALDFELELALLVVLAALAGLAASASACFFWRSASLAASIRARTCGGRAFVAPAPVGGGLGREEADCMLLVCGRCVGVDGARLIVDTTTLDGALDFFF